ncbi:hypothetical protein HNQ75_001809 [Rhizobium flavum]|uniref:Uncharacterized protein n=1 Tax=Pseudorhizobium flavum TaxID=1335061 RepID=A0A7X0DD95_9HYPH|nr:hypothetical protein [Pseudorhizobium flavum]CAD6597134.1 hypothetical protein RFYW14_00459 [Pseudorhizobium flavum]
MASPFATKHITLILFPSSGAIVGGASFHAPPPHPKCWSVQGRLQDKKSIGGEVFQPRQPNAPCLPRQLLFCRHLVLQSRMAVSEARMAHSNWPPASTMSGALIARACRAAKLNSAVGMVMMRRRGMGYFSSKEVQEFWNRRKAWMPSRSSSRLISSAAPGSRERRSNRLTEVVFSIR